MNERKDYTGEEAFDKMNENKDSLSGEAFDKMNGSRDFIIEEELKKLPDKPGVYIMHDEHDTIIYVGKAVVLKNRVRQYFQKGYKKSPKIQRMVSKVNRFEYIVTDSELEALVLESNLIKEHRPKYNTMLKDDKNYPYIRVNERDVSQSPHRKIDEKGWFKVFWPVHEFDRRQGYDRAPAEALHDPCLQQAAPSGSREGPALPLLSYRTVSCPVSGKCPRGDLS